ncbi:MAG: hypothetical protein ACREQJ_04195, partial [Candidatus Binatia bacterium]
EMRGNRGRAEITTTATHELDSTVTELRLAGGYAEVTITGEKRDTIEARLRVTSTGYDEAEAKKLAGETRLKVDRAGGALRLTSVYPEPGRQQAFLTLLVPARMAVRLAPGSQRTTVANAASIEADVRGETSLKNIAGRTTLTHRAGNVLIENVAALKLTGRGSDATVTNVRGEASFSMQSGELSASGIGGPIDVDAQNTEVAIKKLEDARGPLRVNAVGGSVRLDGLSGEARIDGRNTEVDIEMGKPAAVAVYNEGNEPIEIVLPQGGFVLDALAAQGRLTVPGDLDAQLNVSAPGDDKEQRAHGAVRGGGPTITLRANRGDIRITAPSSTKPER